MGTLTDATDGMLQDGDGSSCVKVIARENETTSVVAAPRINTTARTPNPVVVARSQPSTVRIAHSVLNQRSARTETEHIVATTSCGATPAPPTAPSPGGMSVFTPSKANGYVQPLYAGQIVCSVSGTWRPATTAPNRADAVGMLVDEMLLIGAAGQAQTTGVLTLTVLQWDEISTSIGGLVPEAMYYLHSSGKISPSPPEASGEVLLRLGYALSSTSFSLDIDTPVLL